MGLRHVSSSVDNRLSWVRAHSAQRTPSKIETSALSPRHSLYCSGLEAHEVVV
jgi:hypothetical protein